MQEARPVLQCSGPKHSGRSVHTAQLAGVAEMDETYFLESYKGRKVVGHAPRKRGGRAAKRGLSREQIPVLVARDGPGVTTDYVLTDCRKAAVMVLLKPLLPTDDCSVLLRGQAAELGLRPDSHDAVAWAEEPVATLQQDTVNVRCSRRSCVFVSSPCSVQASPCAVGRPCAIRRAHSDPSARSWWHRPRARRPERHRRQCRTNPPQPSG